MKSLAFFSPLSPVRGGVAHYGDALAKELSRYYKLIFYIEKEYEPVEVKGLGEIRLHTEYRGEEDRTLFQASNGSAHGYMYPYLLKGDAVFTLHDQTLHDMALLYWEGKPRRQFWPDFFRNEGFQGLRYLLETHPNERRNISARIMYNLYGDEEGKRMRFRFVKRIASGARGIIAHSLTVRDAAIKFGANCPIMVVPLAVEPAPPEIPKDVARKSLNLERSGIDSKTFVILAFGYIQRHKRIEALLAAWKQFTEKADNVKLVLLGPKHMDFDVEKVIAQKGLGDKIVIDGSYPPMEVVYQYIYASDLCVNLRYPVLGSSSYSLMQILSAGRPCVVTNLETFAEFSDDVVLKVPYGKGEIEALEKIFLKAAERRNELQKMGTRAREWVESACLWSHAGPRYHQFLEQVYAG